MDGRVSQGRQRRGQGGHEDGRAAQAAAVFWCLLTLWAQSGQEGTQACLSSRKSDVISPDFTSYNVLA